MGDFFSQNVHVARIGHKCGSCHRGILPGIRYTAYSGMSEGDFWTTKHCPECAAGYAAYEAYMNDRTRKGWKYTCSDEWLCFDEFAYEVREWLDYFDLSEIEADTNLKAMIAAMPSVTTWFAQRQQRELADAKEDGK